MPRLYTRRDPQERFWEKVDAAGDCWEWQARVNESGYGRFSVSEEEHVYAHRYAWTVLVGPIPAGMELDHLCRNHRCVNPDHLEVVTKRINALRGFGASGRHSRQTRCVRGHPFNDTNTRYERRGGRTCRTCKRERERIRREKALACARGGE